MRYKKQTMLVLSLAAVVALVQCTKFIPFDLDHGKDHPDQSLVNEGKQIFRFDTFGDEDFWSGTLHIDKAIAGANNGGFGSGVSPKTALAVGLKVDVDALPPDVLAGIISGAIDLNDPATTIALLKLNSVVGIKGNFDTSESLKSV